MDNLRRGYFVECKHITNSNYCYLNVTAGQDGAQGVLEFIGVLISFLTWGKFSR